MQMNVEKFKIIARCSKFLITSTYRLFGLDKERASSALTLYLMGGGIECLPLAKTAPVH